MTATTQSRGKKVNCISTSYNNINCTEHCRHVVRVCICARVMCNVTCNVYPTMLHYWPVWFRQTGTKICFVPDNIQHGMLMWGLGVRDIFRFFSWMGPTNILFSSTVYTCLLLLLQPRCCPLWGNQKDTISMNSRHVSSKFSAHPKTFSLVSVKHFLAHLMIFFWNVDVSSTLFLCNTSKCS